MKTIAIYTLWFLALVLVPDCASAQTQPDVIQLEVGQGAIRLSWAQAARAERYLIFVDPQGPTTIPTLAHLLSLPQATAILTEAERAAGQDVRVELTLGQHVLAVVAANQDCEELKTLGHCWSEPATKWIDLRRVVREKRPDSVVTIIIAVEPVK